VFELGHGSEVVPQALPKPFLPIRVEGVIEEPINVCTTAFGPAARIMCTPSQFAGVRA
jgi:hypothetical protein